MANIRVKKNKERLVRHKKQMHRINSRMNRDYLDKLPNPVVLPDNITAHVIIRYLERIKGVDIKSVIYEIQEIIKPAKVIGDGNYHVGDLVIVVKNGKAVTCMERKKHES